MKDADLTFSDNLILETCCRQILLSLSDIQLFIITPEVTFTCKMIISKGPRLVIAQCGYIIFNTPPHELFTVSIQYWTLQLNWPRKKWQPDGNLPVYNEVSAASKFSIRRSNCRGFGVWFEVIKWSNLKSNFFSPKFSMRRSNSERGGDMRWSNLKSMRRSNSVRGVISGETSGEHLGLNLGMFDHIFPHLPSA